MPTNDARRLLLSLFNAAVAAAHPSTMLAQHLPAPPRGKLIVLAAGKAAGSMTEAAEAHYLDTLGLPPERLIGHAVARHGYGRPTRRIAMVEAGHPVPDEAGLTAAARALELAAGATADDQVLVLLSGGASANWIAPVAGVSFADKQAVNRALLRSGAAIGEINAVRKHLSRIKGGRLAARVGAAALATLAVSDVPGDDPAVIGSGPTVPDPTILADARAVVARYGLTLPPSVAAALADPANESPKPGALPAHPYTLIATPEDALRAAERAAVASGYDPVVLGSALEGEARDVAAQHARLALDLQAAGKRAIILSGGEFTVTLPKGNRGRGGPNQEYALALALALAGAPGIAALAADTDGTDGGGGDASDPAGALIDPTTLHRARAAGIDPAAALQDHDSTAFFAALGDLVAPGPTFTNVNDIRAILVDSA